MTTKPAERIDAIAATQHEIWANQANFLLSCGEARSDGSIVLSADVIARFRRQIDTPYANLPVAGKTVAKEQAAKIIAVLEGESNP